MAKFRDVALSLSALFLAANFPVFGQSVVSTHSGVVYFFDGAVSIAGERLEQKFGKFPDIGEGRELRTEHGRAEVLLTPGVFLRVAENSAIRMVSNKLADTRVELLNGSAILEATDKTKDTSVALIYRKWQVRVPHEGVCRIDSEPAQLRVYKGEIEVATDGRKDTVTAKEGETLPLADVLLTEKDKDASPAPGETDGFKTWAMNRSQVIAADNATAAEILDDPSQIDTASGLAMGGYSYFPPTSFPTLGITNPYGLSFWSPYQSMLTSLYFPSYMYGVYGSLYGVHRGWPTGYRTLNSPSYGRPIYSRPTGGVSLGTISGGHPGIYISPRPPYSGVGRTVTAPAGGVHPGVGHMPVGTHIPAGTHVGGRR